jgi:hypothetical protein
MKTWGSGGIAPPFTLALDKGEWSVSFMHRQLCLLGKQPPRYPLDRRHWWAPEPVRMFSSREKSLTLAQNWTPNTSPQPITILTQLSCLLIICNSSERCCLLYVDMSVSFRRILGCQLLAPFTSKNCECIWWAPNFCHGTWNWHVPIGPSGVKEQNSLSVRVVHKLFHFELLFLWTS